MMEIVPLNLQPLFVPPMPRTICKVCGLPAHGVHFGVTACRACAAFFRRFVVLNLEYDCLQDKKKCSLNQIRRSSCRHCRFQKCLRMGMTADNVQWNRDVYSTDMRYKKLKSPESKHDENVNIVYPSTSQPSRSLYSIVRTQDQLYTQSILSEINYDNIQKEMHKMFMSDIPSTDHGYFASLSPLYQIVEGIQLVRKSQQTENIKFENRLSMETLVPHWRAQAKNTAIMSMHSMAFRNIPLTEKSRIFKSLWQNIYRFERIQMSTEIFGEECVNEKKLAISCERAIQLDSLFFDIEGVAQNKLNVTLQDYKTFAQRCVEEVAKPLAKLKLSIEEVAYLILNFVMHNEESIIGDSLEICDAFRDRVANCLHEYYQKNNITNYAQRISKMMSIINAMKRIHYDDLGGTFVANARNAMEIEEISKVEETKVEIVDDDDEDEEIIVD
uniref:NR LBD domain-containing protein n=2 Tax=Caenorhabditis tropicalis TaxID=1561998 RepID=A0A1I7UKC2_9PELO